MRTFLGDLLVIRDLLTGPALRSVHYGLRRSIQVRPDEMILFRRPASPRTRTPDMTRSRSTRRIRFTQAVYLTVVLLVAVSDRPVLVGTLGAAAQLGGLLVMGFAALGRLWTSLFIAGSKERELVTDGPYSVCRNPLYVFSLIGAAGVGLASRSVTLTVASPVLFALVFARVVRTEEVTLAATHGGAYAAYLAAVPRFLPELARYRPRAEACVPTRLYFKAFLDAASFLLLYVLVALADLFGSTGFIPAWLVLP